MDKFKRLVREKLAKDIGCEFEDTFEVWSCKVIQNKKVIVSASKKNAPLIEATFDGDRQRVYYDTYEKVKKETIVLNPQDDNLSDTIVEFMKGKVQSVPRILSKFTGLFKKRSK